MIFFLVSAPTGSYIVARFIWQSGTPLHKQQKRIPAHTEEEHTT
jgi:multisubunit Na+/H+ antiporter MnhG subunit